MKIYLRLLALILLVSTLMCNFSSSVFAVVTSFNSGLTDDPNSVVFEAEFIESYTSTENCIEGGVYRFKYFIPPTNTDGEKQVVYYMKIDNGLDLAYNLGGNAGVRDITFKHLENRTYTCTIYTSTGDEYKTSFKVDYITSQVYKDAHLDLTEKDYESTDYAELSFSVISDRDDGSYQDVYYSGENYGVPVMVSTNNIKCRIFVNGAELTVNEFVTSASFTAYENDVYFIMAQTSTGRVTECNLHINFLQPEPVN